MVLAPVEEFIAANKPFVAGEHVVKEHRNPGAAKRLQGEDLKFNFDAGFLREIMTELVQRVAIAVLEEVAIPANKNIKFQIVVRSFAFSTLEHASFTSAISAAEQEAFDACLRKNAEDRFARELAAVFEMSFESVTSINGVTGLRTRADRFGRPRCPDLR